MWQSPPSFFFCVAGKVWQKGEKGECRGGTCGSLKCLRTTAREATKYIFKQHSVCYFSATRKARYMKRKNICLYRLRCNYMFLVSHARIISFASWRDLFHTVKNRQCLHKISAPCLFRYVTGLQVFTLMVHSRAA